MSSVHSTPTANRRAGSRLRMWLLIAAGLVLLAVAVVVFMMMRMNSVPDGLNTAETLNTENGAFTVSYQPPAQGISINQIQSWTIHVATPDGQPVEDAQITVDGGMPQHGHGLPTRPQVTQNLGGGDYLVEGLKFQMTGWWELKLAITAGGQTDHVTFNLMLE